MSSLIFNEESMLTNNLYKYEERLKSHVSKYLSEAGALLTTYYSIWENATTVDRGIQDIEKLFGQKSPLRFNKIKNFPLYGFGQANPANTDEIGIEDINVEGDCVVLPSTIVPNPNDFFTINHLTDKGIRGVFQIVEVQYDSMKIEGYYKVRYRLISTSEDTMNNLENKVIQILHTDLNAVGSNLNPIIKEDDFIRRTQIQQMVNQMIQSYRSMFYNERHNCFLINDQEIGGRLFDMCGNEFIAKHSLMNPVNSNKVIILHNKLRDERSPLYYNHSIYNWLELGAPRRLMKKFHFKLVYSDVYPDSSFVRWADGDIQIIQPQTIQRNTINTWDHDTRENSYFDAKQFDALDGDVEPTSEFEKLIWKFTNKQNSLSIQDVSLYTADTLLSLYHNIDVFLYTPIIIFIIRKILRMN